MAKRVDGDGVRDEAKDALLGALAAKLLKPEVTKVLRSVYQSRGLAAAEAAASLLSTLNPKLVGVVSISIGRIRATDDAATVSVE